MGLLLRSFHARFYNERVWNITYQMFYLQPSFLFEGAVKLPGLFSRDSAGFSFLGGLVHCNGDSEMGTILIVNAQQQYMKIG